MDENMLDVDFTEQPVEVEGVPEVAPQKPKRNRPKPNGAKPASRPAPQKKDFTAIIDQAATVAKAYGPKTTTDLEAAWAAGLTAAKALNKL